MFKNNNAVMKFLTLHEVCALVLNFSEILCLSFKTFSRTNCHTITPKVKVIITNILN